ncbi:MAG: orc1/cdc6 family replication initiation protein [Candidatus Aenigmarchaeota archaeon]|nr:orc1/cdc6 family replication initiation protein [Candidatus Aenigmarchaeota archaeon]
MEENKIIKDIRILTEDFIPSRIVHRESQLSTLRDCLKPAMENKSTRNVFMHGSPGTGKTCISSYLISELKENADISTAYVNCWKNSTRFNVLYKIVSDLGFNLSVHRKGTPLDELLYIMENKLSEKPCIIILDELDRIENDRVIYDLLSFPQISIIMIANTETAMYNFDTRIRSRLSSSENIQFPSYSNSDIVDILKDRAEWGLFPNVIKDSQVEKIAEMSGGDARSAIGVLRNISEHADNKGLSKIPEKLMEKPVIISKLKDMQNLNENQKTICSILERKNKISPSELYQNYLVACEECSIKPVTERRLRTFVEELISSGIISSEGNTKSRVYFLN